MIVKEWRTSHGDKVTVYFTGPEGLTRNVYRYRVQARNGQIVEIGSEGYTRKSAAIKAARRHHPEVTP